MTAEMNTQRNERETLKLIIVKLSTFVVPGRARKSSGSGSLFEQSSGSGLIGFVNFG